MPTFKRPTDGKELSEAESAKFFADCVDLVLSYSILYTPKENEKTQLWLNRFYKMKNNDKELNQRNEYIWYLLVQMQNGNVGNPFNKTPPPMTRALPSLESAVIGEAYNRNLMLSHEQGLAKEQADAFKPNLSSSSRKDNFLYSQPVPNCGFTAYGACFSGGNQ